MNIKKFRKNLNKIYAIVGEEDVALNSIEQDLVKSYILNLYESINMQETVEESKPKKAAKTPVAKKKVVAQIVEEAVEIEEPEEEIYEEEIIEEVVAEAPIVEPIIEEVVEEIEEEVVETVPEPVYEHQGSIKQYDIDDSLFDFKKGSDVSDKLSNLPIADLTRCMGINEYIFTKDELFDGDKDKMVDSLEDMNGRSSFDSAKEVLMDLAQDYDWSSKSKINKAKNFIRLVKRRYN